MGWVKVHLHEVHPGWGDACGGLSSSVRAQLPQTIFTLQIQQGLVVSTRLTPLTNLFRALCCRLALTAIIRLIVKCSAALEPFVIAE